MLSKKTTFKNIPVAHQLVNERSKNILDPIAAVGVAFFINVLQTNTFSSIILRFYMNRIDANMSASVGQKPLNRCKNFDLILCRIQILKFLNVG